jgi:hypothetical protein
MTLGVVAEEQATGRGDDREVGQEPVARTGGLDPSRGGSHVSIRGWLVESVALLQKWRQWKGRPDSFGDESRG